MRNQMTEDEAERLFRTLQRLARERQNVKDNIAYAWAQSAELDLDHRAESKLSPFGFKIETTAWEALVFFYKNRS